MSPPLFSSAARRRRAPFGAAALVAFAAASGCGVEANGVDECRQLESARCRSAEVCGVVADVLACERYVEDQCRHGFASDLGPSKTQLRACVSAIEDIGKCAKRSGRKTDPAQCDQGSLESARVDEVCDLVERPERLPDCRFLASEDELEVDAASTNDPEPSDERETSSESSGGSGASRRDASTNETSSESTADSGAPRRDASADGALD